jgi:hypothetical protein
MTWIRQELRWTRLQVKLHIGNLRFVRCQLGFHFQALVLRANVERERQRFECHQNSRIPKLPEAVDHEKKLGLDVGLKI